MNVFQLKREICEIGRRVYDRGFAAANDGNITYRLSDNEVLCTPTMICKGFMQPEDMCTVDLDGNQLSGRRKRTSEVLLHLAIMKQRPDMKACVHCHPPHATAFAVAREPIPQCVLPEVEVFLGEVPIAEYETPGTQKFADTVLPYVDKCNVMILANHGTVSFGESLEQAYWWTEILDAYCRILMLSRNLGRVNYFTPQQTQELLDLKQRLGFKDPRLGADLQDCDLCANDTFRESWRGAGVDANAFPASPHGGDASGVQRNVVEAMSAPGGAAPAVLRTMDEETLVQTITDRVISALQQQ